MIKKPQGFILIYVIGILIFLAVVGLGVAYALRINTQIVIREKENLQNEKILESSVQYTLAQMARTRAVDPLLKTADPVALKLFLWRPGMGPYQLEIQGVRLDIALDDAGGLPDINVLTKEEMQRIFTTLGAPAHEAVILAEFMFLAAQRAGKERGGAGFASMHQVLQLDVLPAVYRYGVKPKVGSDGTVGEIERPGLAQLVTVGTGSKKLNFNLAPLQIIGALANVEAAGLAKFDAARREKPLTLAEAVQLLGEPARPILQDGPSPASRIGVRMARNGHLYGAEALAVEEGGNTKIVMFRMTQPGNE